MRWFSAKQGFFVTWDDFSFFFFFEKKNHFCTKIAAIEATSFPVECRKSFWSYFIEKNGK